MAQGVVLDDDYLAQQRAMAARVQRVSTWVDLMQSYRPLDPKARANDDVRRARELYIAGTITLEAFEASLDVAFGITTRRDSDVHAATS